ncbi:MAG: FAD-dependent oxidoreductase [Armatimonadetes bacterium]|nr:FAD-dependent oxidoreductase [Armatimonadota bacterium]
MMQTVRRAAGDALDLGSFDVVVCGGSLSGWAAAVKLARMGRKVLLAAERTALGWEVWGALSLWLTGELERPPLLDELIAELSEASAVTDDVLDPVATEVALDHIAATAGVRLLFQVIAHARDEEEILLAGKWGTMVARAPLVVDATPGSLVARERGAVMRPCHTSELPLRRALMVQAELEENRWFPVPDNLPVAESRVLARAGRWPRDAVLEASLTLDYADLNMFEPRSRRVMLDIGAHLRKVEPAFVSASFVHVAHDAVMCPEQLCAGTEGEPLLAAGVDGVVLASPYTDCVEVGAAECLRPERAIRVGEAAGVLAGEIIGG